MRRLHPLLREHYVRRLAAEVPVRKQRLHRGIADALARRGHMIPAWRHASETGDRRFLGEMMERVGVFRMWLREGKTCLAAADRFLTPVLSEEFPAPRRHPLRGPPPAVGVRRGAHAVPGDQAQARPRRQ